MLRLHVVPAEGDPFDLPLEGERLSVGRSQEADLALADGFLSRNHACFVREGDAWVIEDLGSRNGTLLNDKRVETSSPICQGDILKISDNRIYILGVNDPNPEEAPAIETSVSTEIFRPALELMDSGLSAKAAESRGKEAVRYLADRLDLLNEVHQALNRPMALSQLLDLILERVYGLIKPEEAAIFLKGADGELERAAGRASSSFEGESFFSRRLVDEVAGKGLAALVVDTRTDARFTGAMSVLDSGVRSLVAAPLLDSEGSLGMIVLSSRVAVRQFSEDDMDVLVSVASVAALKIRNAALVEEAAERRLMEEEVKLARRIQVALLPERLPEVTGYELYGGNIPSRGVSGDFYEIVKRRKGSECVFLLADVSGKGVGASLLTACLEALAAGPIEDGLPPDEICFRLSRLLDRRTPPDKFATAFVAALEIATGVVTYANAGHNSGLVVRSSGEVERLESTGLPLGLISGERYATGTVILDPGALLILYTDGITEAADPEDEEYGLERLEDVCRRHRDESLEELSLAAERDLGAFARGVPFADDRTLVLARRLPS